VDFRIGLDVRDKNLSVLAEVAEEGVTAPTTHDLHHFHRHP
jgi:hypothetical protein